MECKKCGAELLPRYAYCPFCGVKTEALKNKDENVVTVRRDNSTATGLGLLFVGLLLLIAGAVMMHIMLVMGLGIATLSVGIIVLYKRRQFLRDALLSGASCCFCDEALSEEWTYCCTCGTKVKD